MYEMYDRQYLTDWVTYVPVYGPGQPRNIVEEIEDKRNKQRPSNDCHVYSL